LANKTENKVGKVFSCIVSEKDLRQRQKKKENPLKKPKLLPVSESFSPFCGRRNETLNLYYPENIKRKNSRKVFPSEKKKFPRNLNEIKKSAALTVIIIKA
jgi:hypothetical protein